MRRLQPVVWAKGTFLSPQYLQSQDIFHEDLLQFRVDSLVAHPWGFRNVQINHEALAAGNFALDAAAGIFPDGLVFDIPRSDIAPGPKPLASYFEAGKDAVDVYLAVPAWRQGAANVNTGAVVNADTRYLAEVVMMRDENIQADRPVQVAKKNFRFLIDGEAREGTPAIQVGRVNRTGSGLFELDSSFIPPILDLAASPRLMSLLSRLLELMTAKGSALAGMRRQRNQGLADFSAADIANFWLLYTINSYVPDVRHFYETRRGHPQHLFASLSSFAGSLTAFSTKIAPRDLPVYDHRGLAACFRDLDEKLRFLLETVIPSNFVSLPLALTQSSIYATAINDDKLLRNTKMYLAINAGMPEGDLILRTPTLVKTCSATHLEHLIRQALPGLQLRHVPVPPSSIPIKLEYQYFSINQSGPAWEAVLRARNFGAYVPADFPNPQLELIVILPQGEKA